MVKRGKYVLTGYRAEGVDLYTTKLKPLGRIVAGVGFILAGYGALTLWCPVSGSIFTIGGGLSLLGLVGINTVKLEKKFKNKLRFTLWKLRN